MGEPIGQREAVRTSAPLCTERRVRACCLSAASAVQFAGPSVSIIIMRSPRVFSVLLVCAVLALVCVCGADALRLRSGGFSTGAAAAAAPVAAEPRKAATTNPRPIIGIFSLAMSDDDNETRSMIPASYVKSGRHTQSAGLCAAVGGGTRRCPK
jgi:hypothetical protein